MIKVSLRHAGVQTALAVGLITFPGCRASSQETATGEPVYPARVTLKPLASEVKAKYGIVADDKANELDGAFCWSGRKNSSSTAMVVQRVNLSPKQLPVNQTFEVNGLSDQFIANLMYPSFVGNSNRIFAWATHKGTDIGESSLYEFDFQVKRGALREPLILAIFRFQISPDGTSYAYESDDPRNGGKFQLMVNSQAGDKVLSNDQYARTFVWSSQSTLMYSETKGKPDPKYYEYPNIYETDLDGKSQLVKTGGYFGSVSLDRNFIAHYAALPDSKNPVQNSEELVFDPRRIGRVALNIYDRRKQESRMATRIYESYPDLFWSKDSQELFVAEKFYSYSKKTAHCRISAYDLTTGSYRNLCVLKQTGESTSPSDEKFLPAFTPLEVANNKYLLVYVPTNLSGIDNYSIIAVDLKTGKDTVVAKFTSAPTASNLPDLDWLDAQKVPSAP